MGGTPTRRFPPRKVLKLPLLVLHNEFDPYWIKHHIATDPVKVESEGISFTQSVQML